MLVKRNWDVCALLVRISNCEVALKNSLVVLKELNIELPVILGVCSLI
jgi:hypothetical protein